MDDRRWHFAVIRGRFAGWPVLTRKAAGQPRAPDRRLCANRPRAAGQGVARFGLTAVVDLSSIAKSYPIATRLPRFCRSRRSIVYVANANEIQAK